MQERLRWHAGGLWVVFLSVGMCYSRRMETVARPIALAPIRALRVLGCWVPSSSCSMMESRDMSRPCRFAEDFFVGRSNLAERLVFEVQCRREVA